MSNQLKNELSPYLQLHKDQPVDWYPWCKEAFLKAEKENKPVFLSIGYSTCHWCHVMAEECFEDEEIAAVLNRSFVSVKVDREEYPDIDTIYMNVCRSLTGSGGWPLTLFLTSDQKPFFAGTYFPKHGRGRRIGFLDLLKLVEDKWKKDYGELESQADLIVKELSATNGSSSEIRTEMDWVSKGIDDLKRCYDPEHGGFGTAPKFPTPQNLLFLADRYETEGDDAVPDMLETTLLQMAKGGIYDHIGGGFCRYSTDTVFLVPHFEKMLYDNALLILAYAKAWELTKNDVLIRVAEKTAAFLCREMKSSTGGLYAAQDADSDGEEGSYYLFAPEEIIEVLGKENGSLFNYRYDITEKGNFNGKNIPNLLYSEISEDDFQLGNRRMEQLDQKRKERFSLFTDEKVLTSWNGMAIYAFASLYRVTGKTIYLTVAEEIYRDLIQYASSGYCLLRGHRGDHSMEKGTSEDYAWFIRGLIALYEATLEDKYRISAKAFCDEAIRCFWDSQKGGFFLRNREETPLIMEVKESFDHAYPSANAVMTENLRLLALLTEDPAYEDILQKQLRFMKRELASFPSGSYYFLTALNRMEEAPKRIVCAGVPEDPWETVPLKVGLRDILLKKTDDPRYPVIDQKMTYYICGQNACYPPRHELNEI